MSARAPRKLAPAPSPLPSRIRQTGRPRGARASSQIYSDLRGELVSLSRRPGDIISESEIALAYGVSRTPVREAILKLADEGLVEIFPQSGIFVSRIPIAALPEAIIVRKALEETTARMAAERATASQSLNLHAIIERQREANAVNDRDAFHQADELFHATIADVAGHPGIWRLILQVKVHVDRYRRLTLPQAGRMVEVIAEHEPILAAIKERDAQAASAAMSRHLERLLEDISSVQTLNPDFFDCSK